MEYVGDDGKLFSAVVVKVLLQYLRPNVVVGYKRNFCIHQPVWCLDCHGFSFMDSVKSKMLCLAHYTHFCFIESLLCILLSGTYYTFFGPVYFFPFGLCAVFLLVFPIAARQGFRKTLFLLCPCSRSLRLFFTCGQKRQAASADH